MLVQAWAAKYRRHIVLGIVATLIVICIVVGFDHLYAYLIGEPSFAEAKKTLLLIRRGSLKPSHYGLVETAHQVVYVSHAPDGALTVLWPYNLAHDDNYFEGLLFSDKPLKSSQTTALAPCRHGYVGAPSSRPTSLTVDRIISNQWYHVQSEMHK